MRSIALSSTAVDGVKGRPSESSGIIPPPAAALWPLRDRPRPRSPPCPARAGTSRPSSRRRRDERRDRRRRAGNQPDEKAEHGAAQHRRHRPPQLLAARIQLTELHPRRRHHARGCGHRRQHLGDAEEAGRDRDEAEAGLGAAQVEREAHAAAQRIHADGREHDPDYDHAERLHARASGEVGEQHHAEHREGEVLGGTEGERRPRHQRRRDLERDDAEGAGHERRDGGHRERGAGSTLARER